MSFDDTFPKRVSIARSALGMTQDELALKVGVVRRQIAAYEGGEAKPRPKALQNLAAALGTTSDWLASGNGVGPDLGNVRKTITLREIPVISHMQINLSPNSSLLDVANIIDFIPAPLNAGENTFAVLIEGDSMTSPKGFSFPSGTIVTFDPDINVSNGDYVLCGIYGERLLTFKQYIKDQGKFYLKSLNPEFSAFQISEFRVLGVAIHSQMNLGQDRLKVREISTIGTHRNIEIQKQHSQSSMLESRISAIEHKLDAVLKLLRNIKPT